ncbi:MAG TPA: hypothetical protein VGI79_04375 [Caulobacteraceae bacterium]|jgi:hypothetical protein
MQQRVAQRSPLLLRLARQWVRRTLLALAMVGLTAAGAAAVPSFAVQTGQTCNACHVGGFGPQLTPFGREFKMGGYTLRTNSFNLPVSAMAVASYVRTQEDQANPPAPHFRDNDNVAIDQVSLFLAGGLGAHLGGFIQTTYDGVAEAFHWDNLDLRATTTTTIKGANVVLGVSLNNAPTVQDAFNTLPAWGSPYTASALAPAPGSAPLIGSLAQSTLGITGYAWINSTVLIEAGGYRSPGSNFLSRAGVDPTDPGGIRGVAPYGRVAYQNNMGDQNFEVGAFGMAADLNPGRDTTTGLADRYTDIGLDGSYQYFAANKDVFTLNTRYTYERQHLAASQALGMVSNDRNDLKDLRFDASYYWRNKIGATVGAFDTTGSSDPLLYGANRTLKPDSSGVSLQVDGTPFGGGGSPLGARFNLRVGVQYIAYLQFDGAGRNFDGLGHNAGDNNTLRVFTWVAY